MDFTAGLPPKATRPARWVAEANECRLHPGEWALLASFSGFQSDCETSADVRRLGVRARLLAHSVRTGRLAAFRPAGSFEAATRSSATARDASEAMFAVYVRYIGEHTA